MYQKYRQNVHLDLTSSWTQPWTIFFSKKRLFTTKPQLWHVCSELWCKLWGDLGRPRSIPLVQSDAYCHGGKLGERPTPMLCWRSMKRMGASLKGGTPHFTPQNDQFLVGKPMVVGYHHFRKPPYIYPVFFVGWQKVSFWAMKIVNPYHLRILLMVQKSGKFTSWGW